jgi:hypothetical protein
MQARRPHPAELQASLLSVLRNSGIGRGAARIYCRVEPALCFPTYVISAAGEARMAIAAALENILQREFRASDERWVLEAEEARFIARAARA